MFLVSLFIYDYFAACLTNLKKLTLQGQEALQLKRLRKTSSYDSTLYLFTILQSLWSLIINVWMCTCFLSFPGGTFRRSFGSVHAWDGALFAQARNACSVEQRSIICFFCFLHHICIYYAWIYILTLSMVYRCCRTCFRLCCLRGRKAFVTRVSSDTGMFVFYTFIF